MDAELYDELPLWSAMAGLLLLRHVPMGPAGPVLDVGCGTGFPLLELAGRLGPGSVVHGLDVWPEALARARRKAAAWGLDQVVITQGDAAAMPFAAGQFGLVVSSLGLNNFPDPAGVLKECHRVLRPSGRLAIATNLRGHMAELYQVYEQTLHELGRQAALAALRDHVDHRTTPERLAALLARTGFLICRIEQEEAVMRFADGAALLSHPFIRLGFLDGWKGVVAAGEQAEVMGRLKDNLDLLAAERGELALTVPFAYFEAERVP